MHRLSLNQVSSIDWSDEAAVGDELCGAVVMSKGSVGQRVQ